MPEKPSLRLHPLLINHLAEASCVGNGWDAYGNGVYVSGVSGPIFNIIRLERN